MNSNENIWIISSDPDNLGVLVAIFYLMTFLGYSYNEATKYIIAQRFIINLTQDFITFLQYLFVDLDHRPPPNPAVNLINLQKSLVKEEEKKEEPEFNIKDTYQMKLRKNKLPRISKKSLPKANPQEKYITKLIKDWISKDKTEKSLKMIDVIVKNIIENPTEEKYKFLKSKNKKFKKNILKFKAAVELLEFYGFMKSTNRDGDTGYEYPQTTSIQ